MVRGILIVRSVGADRCSPFFFWEDGGWLWWLAAINTNGGDLLSRVVEVRIPDEIMDRLEAYSKRIGTDVGSVILFALVRYVEIQFLILGGVWR